MINKGMVNEILNQFFSDDFVVRLWWGIKLPGLGNRTPNEVWETDPATVLEYVQNYTYQEA
jgi:hypothetical protein